MPIVELENFEFKEKKRNAFKKEGRITWKNQNYPDFLEVNEPFYGDKAHELAKRMFYLGIKEIHFPTTFRSIIKPDGKPDYDKATKKQKRLDTPCQWELKLYFKNGDGHSMCFSNGDANKLQTINYFLHRIVKERINPEGSWIERYEEQVFKKALLIDRYSDTIEFEYPAKSYSVPSFSVAQKELLTITKFFKKNERFPSAEEYSQEFEEELQELELKPTPKIFKQADKEQQQVSNTTRNEAAKNSIFVGDKDPQTLYNKVVFSIIRNLHEVGKQDFNIPIMDLAFAKYDEQNKQLTLVAKDQQHHDLIEEDEKVVSVIMKSIISVFGEGTKLGYYLAVTPVKKQVQTQETKIEKEISIVENSSSVLISETQPKTNETNKVEVESQIVKSEPLKHLYKKNPSLRFKAFLIELHTKTLCTEEEFSEIEFVSLDVENQETTISLPSHSLINYFLKSPKIHMFQLLFRNRIGGTYKVITR